MIPQCGCRSRALRSIAISNSPLSTRKVSTRWFFHAGGFRRAGSRLKAGSGSMFDPHIGGNGPPPSDPRCVLPAWPKERPALTPPPPEGDGWSDVWSRPTLPPASYANVRYSGGQCPCPPRVFLARLFHWLQITSDDQDGKAFSPPPGPATRAHPRPTPPPLRYPRHCPVCGMSMIGEGGDPQSGEFRRHRCLNCGAVVEQHVPTDEEGEED